MALEEKGTGMIMFSPVGNYCVDLQQIRGMSILNKSDRMHYQMWHVSQQGLDS